MTNKKRTSITVDPAVYEFLKQPDVNQSGLINELVKEYKDNERRQVAALKLRREHLLQEAEEAAETAEQKREQAAEVEALLDDARAAESEQLQEAREALAGINDRDLTPDNPAVENWADKLEMTPEELVDTLRST
jgi:hypothetical protein